MIQINKLDLAALLEKAPQRKNISAWNKGVKNYAEWLIDELPDDYCFYFDSCTDLEKHFKILKKFLLNGADNWHQYSYYGNAYIYDGDIAAALLPP